MIIACFHSAGTTPTDSNWLKHGAIGSAREIVKQAEQTTDTAVVRIYSMYSV